MDAALFLKVLFCSRAPAQDVVARLMTTVILGDLALYNPFRINTSAISQVFILKHLQKR